MRFKELGFVSLPTSYSFQAFKKLAVCFGSKCMVFGYWIEDLRDWNVIWHVWHTRDIWGKNALTLPELWGSCLDTS